MPGTTLGTAYVQIMPSAQGIKGNLTNVLTGGEAQGAVSSAGSLLGKGLGTKLLAGMAAAGIAVGLAKVVKASLMQGSALQQSLGGIETLYKGNADLMKKYASQAYKTTGMSANDYMQNVTSFSAGLIKSLGGDTKKAAKVSNMAMVDMADNSNKMGTSMESIQNAYQGFAKQNYTMLDNLNTMGALAA